MFKIGQGFDIHRLTSGNGLWLGGIFIPSTTTVISHSDGDVLFHSMSNALLSALGLEDIGHFFPDHDEKYKNMSSSIILKYAYQRVLDSGYKIQNLSNTILCEKPKLSPYRLNMIHNISTILELEENQLSIHFGTAEGLGFIGLEKGLFSSSTVLILK